MGAVHPKASVGVDGAPFLGWLRGFAAELRKPWRFPSIDFSRKGGPVAEHDRFMAEKAVAASGVHGCRRAQDRVFNATLRGLERATGKQLPKGCFK